ncbi:relaxase/mobilization nuclease domain-containing protein [Clavibacter michiganensis]|uniref:relaxase/mobilization nuclease domain-containing protein n=1 Tax=Clavibacter michiganensis TaxID=28447 RepID=UPI0026DC23D6|nr:relaxase/mobilization nuclease domain-containing protein [Clavibacter michiganensis]MDO4039322.1 relaxase/mobilization nuclease domain-containing protein [Clavibacter michiganensis]MDO4063959.1 relaxase/mobilization nuclease domain-containing protein [Clavibacter michiganensis]MDO4110182.1 relaxase/mobilization nuclease domain-containing protein [Clavibacter michiganensis]MDO4113360.1 relaxase/mobilization nuclease domain-containing protein [Clavibacter michiganensis]MDO4116696.1 relaxase/m
MPHIERGSRMGGLMSYLQGEGRANEHADPHLVAGSAPIMAMYGYDVLDRVAALAIARDLDEPKNAFGTEITRADKSVDPETGETLTRRVDADVWHASLSIAAREGELSDEKWAEIATQFVERMGFAGDELGKADCRWVAVRHGLSKNGNDHVHIAVSLVREDGTKASTHMDFPRAQTICRDLEREHGLEQLHDTERSVAQRGERPGERESAAKRGASEVDAKRLERTIRAAAGASQDEAEFVRRMRRDGVLIRPRFDAGRDDVVAGYSVALRPEKGQQVVWHGGGRLARDLTLPELRKGWPDHPERATEAAAEWRATAKNPWQYKPVSPGREESEMRPEFFKMYADDMVRLHEYIAKLDPNDHASWAHVARDTSAAYAAWSRRLETTPGPLADASRTLARSAQLRASESTPRPVQMPSMTNTTALILAQARKGKNAAAEALLLRQLSQASLSIVKAADASRDARLAQQTVTMMKTQLTQVRDSYTAQIHANDVAALSPEERAVKQRASYGSAKDSPVPTKLTPAAKPTVDVPTTRTPATPKRDDHER